MKVQTLLIKIREKGILGLLHAITRRINGAMNLITYDICLHRKMNDDTIVMESEGDFCDNTYALYDYLRKHEMLKKYRVIWLVGKPENYTGYENTIFVQKDLRKISLKRSYYLATSKYYIYDHCNLLQGLKRRKNQTIFYLSHGAGYKAGKGASLNTMKDYMDTMVATGPLCGEIIAKFWNYPVNQVKFLGYPRNDYFFSDAPEIYQKVDQSFHFSKYQKVILWMPTFRQCQSKEISEDYLHNETGLPMLETSNELEMFNKFLKQRNMLVVLKVHQLQADLPVFAKTFSNILIVKNEQLYDMGVQLYQFIPLMDALITDYSSISMDYVLLDKPIIYTLDDYEEYKKSRGFILDDTLAWMKGHQVYHVSELEEALNDVAEDKDPYREERRNSCASFHTHQDGNSSKRIVEYLGL